MERRRHAAPALTLGVTARSRLRLFDSGSKLWPVVAWVRSGNGIEKA
jgi:hypothetical protein